MNHKKVSSAWQISSIIAFLLYLLCFTVDERAMKGSQIWQQQQQRKWMRMRRKMHKNILSCFSFTIFCVRTRFPPFLCCVLCFCVLTKGKIKIQGTAKKSWNKRNFQLFELWLLLLVPHLNVFLLIFRLMCLQQRSKTSSKWKGLNFIQRITWMFFHHG